MCYGVLGSGIGREWNGMVRGCLSHVLRFVVLGHGIVRRGFVLFGAECWGATVLCCVGVWACLRHWCKGLDRCGDLVFGKLCCGIFIVNLKHG